MTIEELRELARQGGLLSKEELEKLKKESKDGKK